MKSGYLREGKKDDEQGKKEESERESMKDRNREKESVSAEGEQRQRRSGSVKSYCTKYIAGANTSDHVHTVETAGSSRWQEEFLKETRTRGRRGFTLWAEVKKRWWEAAFRWARVCLRMHVYKGGAPCNRISTWREMQAQCNSLMRGRTWSESDGVPRAHSPLQKAPPDTLCYLQVSWDQPMNHVTRWFPG